MTYWLEKESDEVMDDSMAQAVRLKASPELLHQRAHA